MLFTSTSALQGGDQWGSRRRTVGGTVSYQRCAAEESLQCTTHVYIAF